MKLTAESIMRSFQNSGKRHLILTGNRGCGKSTRFREIIKELSKNEEELPGITTYVVPGRFVMLRENRTNTEQRIGIYCNGMQPIASGFFELGVPALRRVAESDSEWVSMDELGFLESDNPAFQSAVLEVFEKKRVIAILRKQEISFLNALKKREDVHVIDLDMETSKIGCVIMASGLSARFGSNKLLAEFAGETLIRRIMNTTSEALFDKRVVVTRTSEVAKLCRKQGVEVILHELPGRNDVVRLGVEHLSDMDGIVFTPCDQPMLTRESFEKLLEVPYIHEDLIVRSAFGERVGTPIFFGKKYYQELCNLPEKKGGAYVAKMHPEKVHYVNLEREEELMDIDTPEDLKKLLQLVE